MLDQISELISQANWYAISTTVLTLSLIFTISWNIRIWLRDKKMEQIKILSIIDKDFQESLFLGYGIQTIEDAEKFAKNYLRVVERLFFMYDGKIIDKKFMNKYTWNAQYAKNLLNWLEGVSNTILIKYPLTVKHLASLGIGDANLPKFMEDLRNDDASWKNTIQKYKELQSNKKDNFL